MSQQRPPAYLQQGPNGNPTTPFAFTDHPVPPYLLQRSPVAASVQIPWSHSAYTRPQSSPIVSVPGKEPLRVTAQGPKRIGTNLVKGPLSSLGTPPPPSAKSSSSASSSSSSSVSSSSSKVFEGKPAVEFDGSNQIVIYVNGKKYVLDNPDPELTLHSFIRSIPGHTGTKQMCYQGGCGACTVMLTYTDVLGEVHNVSVNSCLRPVAQCDGMSVTTIEGVGSTKTGLDPVQSSIADHNGTQCGMCTPGFIMQMEDLLVNNPTPTADDIESHFDGNICRCTGYRPILDAFQTFANGGETAKKEEEGEKKKCVRDIEDLSCCSKVSKYKQKKVDAPRPLLLKKVGESGESKPVWAHPLDLDSLYSLIQTYPNANKKFVVGNTTNGIWPDTDVQLYIDMRSIPDLLVQTSTSKGITVGASVTLTNFIELLETTIQSGGTETRSYAAVLPHMKRVASHQIRNAGCVAGNIMATYLHADFPSDFMVICIAIGAALTYTDPMTAGVPATTIPIENIYKVDMTNKVIQTIFWPVAQTNEVVKTYKVSLRHQFSHAIVNAGFRVKLDPSTMVVQTTPTLAYGGILSQTVRAVNTESSLVGQVWTSDTLLQSTMNSLQSELTPDPSMGRDEYRSSMINSYFYKFYLYSIEETTPGTLPPELISTAFPEPRPISTGEEVYDENPLDYVLPQFVPKLEGKLQVTGEAIYHADTPSPADTLHGAIVMSTEGDADIVSIDTSEALAIEGVAAVLTAEDIPGLNRCDTAVGLEKQYWDPILAQGHVNYYGQAVALVLADTREIAANARKFVKVTYANVNPAPILTIDQALAQNSVFDGVPDIGPVQKGDVDKGLAEAPNTMSGKVYIHDQYHFHMETQTCLTFPKEDSQYELYFSTQFSSVSQFMIAKMLGVPVSNVTINTKRIGGSYGAKITRAIQHGCLSTLGSYHTNRPVLLQLDIQTNMQLVGKRHPYMCDYTIGFTNEGKVTTYKAHVYAGAGFTLEGTDDCLMALLTSLDNCYNYENFYAVATCLRTNLACNTFMRGPGYFQSIFFSDQVFEQMGQILAMNPDSLKRLNFYQKGDVTPYYQTLTYWSMTELWDKLLIKSDYDGRLKQIEDFNKSNRWVKKGIAMVPCKYGMLLSADPFFALVSILSDGSVLVSHGGTDTGQGLNTKVAQAAAKALKVDVSMIRIGTTSTITSPNSSATGGSVTSELCVKATMAACFKLRHRLNPIQQLLGGDVPWTNLIEACVTSGLNLSATGSELDPSSTINPFRYNSYSAACGEVEVDVLTGEVTIKRVDILFDCGISLNPIIDMGQVQGGFVKGTGYYLQELITHDPNTGQVLSDDTWEYKPPMTYNMPIDFRAELERNAPNPAGILGSKASGEPPTCLGSVVFWATEHAMIAARTQNEQGAQDPFLLNTPATIDVVQQNCEVDSSEFYF